MAAEQQTGGFEIDDPEELAQKTRIRELLSRRTKVIDSRDQAFDAMMLGQANESAALKFYRSRIESLILDLWTKFENQNLENGHEYLDSAKVDDVTVHPPDELLNSELAEGESMPEPEKVPIHGLKWFIENDGGVKAEFTARTWNPPGEHTAVGEQQLPRKTLDKALVRCMEFIDEAGIDVNVTDSGTDIIRNFDQSGDEAKADYGTGEYESNPDL